jgi:hypothetical protein
VKYKNLTYILFLLVISFGLLTTSCDGDDGVSIRNIEGHWLYIETRVNISVSDPELKKAAEEYVAKTQKYVQISYEFKNDRTYYCHRDNTDPLKGKFKMLDKNYYLMDDIRGEKKIVLEDNKIYIMSDLRNEIANELRITQDKIAEASITEVFERGLSPN